ncbi:MAG: hypothetical protein R2780_09700 [Crocinitomicaceae bacterium]|nr:hypothetical protein [Crocinitomicaceae bacterium]
MKDSKQCPRCQGTDIYTDEGISKRGDRVGLGVDSWTQIFIATYVCLSCGFIDEYIDKEFMTEKKLEKIRKNWRPLT